MAEAVSSELVQGVTMTITPLKTDTEPLITLFHVSIETVTGAWLETFPTREILDAFIKGVRAAGMMIGKVHVKDPAIPFDDGL